VDYDDKNISPLSRSFVYTVSMNVQSVHNSLKHMLSDGDTIAVLHMHDGIMVCCRPSNKNNRQYCIYYIGNINFTK